MDPASATGIASSSIAFAEFAYEFLCKLYALYDVGRAVEYDELEFISEKMRGLSLDMLRELPTSNQSEDDIVLANLANQCHVISVDIISRIQKNKPKSRRLRDVFKATLRTICSKDEIARLQRNLDSYRAQFHLQYAVSRR